MVGSINEFVCFQSRDPADIVNVKGVFTKKGSSIMSKKEWRAPAIQIAEVKASTQGNGPRSTPGDDCNYALPGTAKCVSGT